MDPLQLNDRVDGFTRFMREFFEPMSNEELVRCYGDALNRTGVFTGINETKMSQVFRSFSGAFVKRGLHVNVL